MDLAPYGSVALIGGEGREEIEDWPFVTASCGTGGSDRFCDSLSIVGSIQITL